MTLEESNRRIRNLDPEDLTQAAEVLAERARCIVQFAAGSDLATLEETHAAGQILKQQLLAERSRLLSELRNSQALRDTLAITVPDPQTRSVCFG